VRLGAEGAAQFAVMGQRRAFEDRRARRPEREALLRGERVRRLGPLPGRLLVVGEPRQAEA